MFAVRLSRGHILDGKLESELTRGTALPELCPRFDKRILFFHSFKSDNQSATKKSKRPSPIPGQVTLCRWPEPILFHEFVGFGFLSLRRADGGPLLSTCRPESQALRGLIRTAPGGQLSEKPTAGLFRDGPNAERKLGTSVLLNEKYKILHLPPCYIHMVSAISRARRIFEVDVLEDGSRLNGLWTVDTNIRETSAKLGVGGGWGSLLDGAAREEKTRRDLRFATRICQRKSNNSS
jgi:hypothetical protein